MNNIKISPEWILESFTTTAYGDGEGNILLQADDISSSRWVDLALKTLGVKYETRTFGYNPNSDEQYFMVEWEFPIETIKQTIPKLYKYWIEMDENQKDFLAQESEKEIAKIKSKVLNKIY